MSRLIVLILFVAICTGCSESAKPSNPKVIGGKALPAELDNVQSAGSGGGGGVSTSDAKGAK